MQRAAVKLRIVPGTCTAVAALVAMAACSALGVYPDRFRAAWITDIVAPAQITPTSILHLRVTVQTGGCIHFDHFEVDRTPTHVGITAITREPTRPDIVCTADIRYEPHPLDVDGPFADPITVVGAQDGGTPVQRVVRVQ